MVIRIACFADPFEQADKDVRNQSLVCIPFWPNFRLRADPSVDRVIGGEFLARFFE